MDDGHEGLSDHLRAVLRHAPDFLARLDTERRYRYVNAEAERITGIPAEEWVGHDLAELGFDTDEVRPWREAIVRALETGEPGEVLAPFVARGGTRWFETRISPERDADGRVSGVVVAARDVSERLATLKDLEKTTRLLFRTLESLAEAVFVIEAETGMIRECNAAAERMFCRSREELVGRSTRRLHVSEEHFQAFGEQSENWLIRGEPFRTHFTMARRDGSPFPTEHTVTLLYPEEGPSGGIVSVVRDRTEEVEAEARASTMQLRLEELLDTLGVGFIRADLDGIILERNDAARRILGLDTSETLVGRPVQEVLGPGETWEGILRQLRSDGPDQCAIQAHILRADGELACVSALGRIVPLPDGGTIVEGVFQDVTEEMRLREEVVGISTRERLRIGQDLHDDLGQHLTGLAFLARDLGRTLADEGHASAASELRELELIANLAVKKTRHIARGVQPPTLEQGGLQGALEELARDVEELFGLSVELDVEDGPETASTAEASHLFRIAQEGTTNAARHGGGTRAEITWKALDARRRLTVRDNGAGFDERKTTPGLGLRIMRYRARLLGGELEIRSDDEGTTVQVTLPSLSMARPWGASPEEEAP